jgi:hypothetical protein
LRQVNVGLSLRADGSSGRCGVSLDYSNAQGKSIFLFEDPLNSTLRYIPPAAPNYQVSEGSGGWITPIWWLGSNQITVHQISLNWTKGNLVFGLGTNDDFSVATMKAIAANI